MIKGIKANTYHAASRWLHNAQLWLRMRIDCLKSMHQVRCQLLTKVPGISALSMKTFTKRHYRHTLKKVLSCSLTSSFSFTMRLLTVGLDGIWSFRPQPWTYSSRQTKNGFLTSVNGWSDATIHSVRSCSNFCWFHRTFCDCGNQIQAYRSEQKQYTVVSSLPSVNTIPIDDAIKLARSCSLASTLTAGMLAAMRSSSSLGASFFASFRSFNTSNNWYVILSDDLKHWIRTDVCIRIASQN